MTLSSPGVVEHYEGAAWVPDADVPTSTSTVRLPVSATVGATTIYWIAIPSTNTQRLAWSTVTAVTLRVRMS